MGKKTSGISGEDKKKDVRDWRFQLSEQDINGISDKRTIDVLLMVENEDQLRTAVGLFDEVVKDNPSCSFKSITFNDILDDVVSLPFTTDDPIVTLYGMALTEASLELRQTSSMAVELLAKLLKLKIIVVIRDDLTVIESEEDRHLYVILMGFYEVKLLKEFWNIGITLSAIVQVLPSLVRHSIDSNEGTKSLHHVKKTTELPILSEKIEADYVKPNICDSRKHYPSFNSFQVDNSQPRLFSADFLIQPETPEKDYITDTKIIHQASSPSYLPISKTIDNILDNVDRNGMQLNTEHFRNLMKGVHRVANFVKTNETGLSRNSMDSESFDFSKSTILVRPNIQFNTRAKKEIGLHARFVDSRKSSQMSNKSSRTDEKNRGYDIHRSVKRTRLTTFLDQNILNVNRMVSPVILDVPVSYPRAPKSLRDQIKHERVHPVAELLHLPVTDESSSKKNEFKFLGKGKREDSSDSGNNMKKKKSRDYLRKTRSSTLSSKEDYLSPQHPRYVGGIKEIFLSNTYDSKLNSAVSVNEENREKNRISVNLTKRESNTKNSLDMNEVIKSDNAAGSDWDLHAYHFSILNLKPQPEEPLIYNLNDMPKNQELVELGNLTNDNLGLVKEHIPLPTINDFNSDGSVRCSAKHTRLLSYLETLYLRKICGNPKPLQLLCRNSKVCFLDLKNFRIPKNIHLLRLLTGTLDPRNSLVRKVLEKKLFSPYPDDVVRYLLTALPLNTIFETPPSQIDLSRCLSQYQISVLQKTQGSPNSSTLSFDTTKADYSIYQQSSSFDYNSGSSFSGNTNLFGYTSSIDNLNIFHQPNMRMSLSFLSNFESTGGTFQSDSYAFSKSFAEEVSSEDTSTSMTLDCCQEFWNNLLKMKDHSKYLTNTAHMRIFPIKRLLFNRSNLCDDEILDSFSELKTIKKIKNRFNSYINNVEIITLKKKPKKLHLDVFKTYKKSSEKIPPECFSIGLILNLAVSEAVARVVKKEEEKIRFEKEQSAKRTSSVSQKGRGSDFLGKSQTNSPLSQKRRSSGRNKRYSNTGGRKESFGKGTAKKRASILSEEEEDEDDPDFIDIPTMPPKKSNPGLKVKKTTSRALAKHLIKTLRKICPNSTPSIRGVDDFVKKLFIKVDDPYYFLNNANLIRYKLIIYPDLLQSLSDINFQMLKKCKPALLMSKFKLNVLDVLIGCHRLQSWWQKTKDISLLHLILKVFLTQFDKMRCNHQVEDIEDTKSKLNLMFPKQICVEVFDFVETDNGIDSLSIVNEVFLFKNRIVGVTIPELFYSPKPCLQESKNVGTYLWYENLDAFEFLQCVAEAEKKFLCLDYKFSIYGNVLLLRYHNGVNTFGINTNVWNGALPTRVNFNQFCKYTLHEKQLPKNIYNLRKTNLIQLTGNTHSFHSVDGFSVDVGQTSFVGHPEMLTISMLSEANYFVFHWDKKKSFQFHFSLENDVTLTFQKPSKAFVGIKVAEMVLRKKNRFCKRPIYTCSFKPADLENTIPIYREEDDFNESERFLNCFMKKFDLTQMEEERKEPLDSQKRKVTTRKTSLKENGFLEEVKCAQKFQNALFSVCSTALHKFSYFGKRKSYVNLECYEKMVRILNKHPKYNLQRKLRTLNLYDINSKIEAKNGMFYNIKFCLPNGLFVSSVASYDQFPCNFKQSFIEKGPQCKAIEHEVSRTFLKNGIIVIRKDDGVIRILSGEGFIEQYELPCKKFAHTKYTAKKCTECCENFPLQTFLKKSQLGVRRKLSHIRGRPGNCRFFRKWRKITKSRKFNNRKKGKKVEPLERFENEMFYSKKYKRPIHTYKSNKATSHLISNCGALVTQFDDGTRITSNCTMEEIWWYKEFVVVDAWILVNIVYTYEHPNYLTISRSPHEARISLPNKTSLVVQKTGQIILAYSNSTFTVTNKKITFKKSCPKCNQLSKGMFNIAPLYKESIKRKPFQLLYVHDTYDKAFRVSSSGKCYQNIFESDKHELNKFDCNHHSQQDHQELFVMNRDFSGMKLIDAKGLVKTIESRFEPDTTQISLVSQNEPNRLNYEAISILTKTKPYYSSYMGRYKLQKLVKKFTFEKDAIRATYINQIFQFDNNSLMKEINEACMKNSPKTMGEIFDYYPIRSKDVIEDEEIFDLHIEKWYKWHKKYEPNCTCILHTQKEITRNVSFQEPKISTTSTDGKKMSNVEKASRRSPEYFKHLAENTFAKVDYVKLQNAEQVKLMKKEILDSINRDKEKYVLCSDMTDELTVDLNIISDNPHGLVDSSCEDLLVRRLNLNKNVSVDIPICRRQQNEQKKAKSHKKSKPIQTQAELDSELNPELKTELKSEVKLKSKLKLKSKRKTSKCDPECKCNPFIEVVRESEKKVTSKNSFLKKK